ncbi:MAG: glycosyltransferase family 2 protein [Elusimicrobia bacterium]|nr:glycosyltransferase family 2 protein [Elusimicrobiota bacterium]
MSSDNPQSPSSPASFTAHPLPEKLSVLIPCYDEQKNIERFEGELFPELEKLGVPFEVIAVDDGSRDLSGHLLWKYSEKHEWFKVVKHTHNQGLGAALRTGLAYASGDALLTLDSDLTFSPKEIPKLWERYLAGDVDCVSGSPILGGYCEVPAYRKFFSRTGSRLYRLLLGKDLTSASPIFRLYRTAILKILPLTSKSFTINAEILFRLIQKNRKIAEVPVTLGNRTHGQSKLKSWLETRNHLKLLLRILLWKIFG